MDVLNEAASHLEFNFFFFQRRLKSGRGVGGKRILSFVPAWLVPAGDFGYINIFNPKSKI